MRQTNSNSGTLQLWGISLLNPLNEHLTLEEEHLLVGS
jgi:hypothetical protein